MTTNLMNFSFDAFTSESARQARPRTRQDSQFVKNNVQGANDGGKEQQEQQQQKNHHNLDYSAVHQRISRTHVNRNTNKQTNKINHTLEAWMSETAQTRN